MALFSTAYWPPVSYYLLAAQSDCVEIEQHERYQKQSYRNRCTILSANGPLSLVVPVLRPHDCGIRDARIDYSKPWQKEHWRAMEAAYRSAAFFEEFGMDIRECYRKEISFLFDLNMKIWELSQKLLGVLIPWRLTKCFTLPSKKCQQEHVAPWSEERPLIRKSADDLRYAIHPKAERKSIGLAQQPYFQVFGHKFGFISDLSILDVILNVGKI